MSTPARASERKILWRCNIKQAGVGGRSLRAARQYQGGSELRAHDAQHPGHHGLPACAEGPGPGASHQAGAGAQGQGLQDVQAGPDSAVHQKLEVAADSIGEVRSDELAGSADLLGVDRVTTAGYADGALLAAEPDDVTATIAAEIGEIERFASPKKLTGYTGLCPRVYRSGGQDRRSPLAKKGP